MLFWFSPIVLVNRSVSPLVNPTQAATRPVSKMHLATAASMTTHSEFTAAGTFRTAAGLDIFGELHIAGDDSYLRLRDDGKFDVPHKIPYIIPFLILK
jgi:hypothetical protein